MKDPTWNFVTIKPISAPKAVERIIVTGIATHPAVCPEITAAMLEQRAALAPMEISVPPSAITKIHPKLPMMTGTTFVQSSFKL